jgi:transcription elongation factor Elf1
MVGDFEDDEKDDAKGKKKKFDEFDCPSCNANNPWPDGLHDNEEVLCHYCGTSYLVRFTDDSRFKLREI